MIMCDNCNKPVFPTEFNQRDRSTWCDCHRVGLPDGWSRKGGNDGREKNKY